MVIIISGLRNSGKTTFSKKIKEYIEKKYRKEVIIYTDKDKLKSLDRSKVNIVEGCYSFRYEGSDIAFLISTTNNGEEKFWNSFYERYSGRKKSYLVKNNFIDFFINGKNVFKDYAFLESLLKLESIS